MWFDPSCPSDAALCCCEDACFPSCFRWVSGGTSLGLVCILSPMSLETRSFMCISQLSVPHSWSLTSPCPIAGRGCSRCCCRVGAVGPCSSHGSAPPVALPAQTACSPVFLGVCVCVYVLVCWFAVCGGALCISVSADRSLLDSYSLLAG